MERKTWNGELTSFSGDAIWSDGNMPYFSAGTDAQYQLNKTTSTWYIKTWSNFTRIYGDYIWTDGEHYYYSFGNSTQYQLDASTWNAKTWNGFTPVFGWNVWTDGLTYFYSEGQKQYQLNKATSTWEPQTWDGITSFNGQFVWTEGTNFYYSDGDSQYQLYPPTPIHYLYKGDTCQWVKPYTITIKVTGTPNSNIKVIIYRSSNAKGQEPSAVYDSSGGESSYVINVASTAADGQQIVGYYGDTLYVKAQSYASGSDRYNIYGQSYTVTGDGRLIVFVGHSVSCSSCHTSARTIRCNVQCTISVAQILLCSNTSADSSKCLN